MIPVAAARLFTCSLLWRGLHLHSAGRVLVRALGSAEEDVRTIAGILVARGGKRAIPLLRESLDRRENLELVVRLVADVGARELEPRVRLLLEDRDENVASAARDALELLALGSRG